MNFARYLILFASLALGSQALAQDNIDPLEKAFVGIGGQQALENLNTLVIEASGTRFMEGEGLTPDEPAMETNAFNSVISYDLSQGNLRLDHNNTITVFGLSTPQEYSEILVGDSGYITGVSNLFGIPERPMGSELLTAIHKQQRLLNPHLILRDILADPSIASAEGSEVLNGFVHNLIVVQDEVHPITLYINAATGLVAKASTLENHYLQRDVLLEAFYVDWQEAQEGMLFPNEVYLALNDQVIHQEVRSSVQVNTTLDESAFTLPNTDLPPYNEDFALRGERSSQFYLGFNSMGIPQDGTDNSMVSAEMLAPGVYHLTGGSHHSMVIEQESGLVVVEAPLYEARSKAVLDWISNEFPDKSITHVIASHSHEDHSGGLRTFVAQGIPVVISEISADFMAEAFEAPSTVFPDELEQNPQTATIETVPQDAPYSLADATHPINVYHLDNSHADDLVMVHLPNEEMLFVVDIYNPGLPFQLFPLGPSNIVNAINNEGISVKTIVGGHAGVGTFEELEAIANQ